MINCKQECTLKTFNAKGKDFMWHLFAIIVFFWLLCNIFYVTKNKWIWTQTNWKMYAA